jgi:hypothetical protein
MLRSYLLWRHHPDIEVIYTPVDAAFYKRGTYLKMNQLKAFVHEYVAIVYYYLKGYWRLSP